MYFNPGEAGERVRDIRKKLGYTQNEFSENIQISRNYLSKIEIGSKVPSIDVWIEISNFTGYSLDYILTGKCVTENEVLEQLNIAREALNRIEGLNKIAD